MTHRVEQVESTMRKALAQVLQRKISDPRIRGMVSITKVSVSTDMKTAKVMISVMPDQYEKRTLAGLRAANRHIHSELKKLVAFRIVPHLEFRLDETLKTSDEIYDAISQAMARTGSEDPAIDANSADGLDDTTTPMDGPDDTDADIDNESSSS